jgi:hypothetical protein
MICNTRAVLPFRRVATAWRSHLGLVYATKKSKRVAKIGVSLRVMRVEPQCLATAALRLSISSQGRERIAQAVVCFSIFRLKPQRLAATNLRFLHAAEMSTRLTENELSDFSRLWHDGCG